VYGTDLGTLRFIAEARSLTMTADSDGVPLSYQLWEDHRMALRAFVHHMHGDQ